MGTTKLNLRHFFTTMLVCTLVAFPTFAAKFDVTGNAFTITPLDTSFGYKLDVDGPGEFTDTVEFAAGELISWSGATEDGVYSFELTPIAAQRERGQDAPAQAPEKISGAITMIGGNFADPRRPESLATKDQVFNDDVIMTFSLCVGNDCVNGESFGFDTLRLKENNLRIHFDDTSTTASFPSNDWRIVVNDSGNGGTNHFSVEDSTAGRSPFRIEAGASANALVVEADSDIGIGTLNPVVELHVVDGDSPTLRLEQDGSSGFTPQTFDLVSNEANFFIRDVTNGSQLPFRIKPGADSDTLFLAANNNVGIQTDSPGAPLHVLMSGSPITAASTTGLVVQASSAVGTSVNASLVSGTSGFSQMLFGDTANEVRGAIVYANSDDSMRLQAGGTTAVTIDSTGDVCVGSSGCTTADVPNDFEVRNGAAFTTINAGDTAVTGSSSRTYKENLEEVHASDILEKISAVDVYTYDFIDGPKDKLGLMAEDFHQIFQRGSDKMLSGQEVQMALWLAVKELAARNSELIERLESLEAGTAE